MFRTFMNAGRLLVAGALTAASACSDLRPPTAPPSNRLSATLPAGAKIKVTKLQLAANTLRIDGLGSAGTAQVSATGIGGPLTGVITHIEIAQPAAVQLGRAEAPINCSGGVAGVLDTGPCDLSFDFSVRNADPVSGTLVPGPAEFRLYIMQRAPDGITILASKTMTVNLVGTPKISSLVMNATYLGINGAPGTFTATLQNPANGLQGVSLQGIIIQGETVRRPASNALVQCGGPPGGFPTGTCVVTLPDSAKNPGTGHGPLDPGPAKFRLIMSQSGTPLDSVTRDITLIPAAPHILSLDFPTTTLAINGDRVDYTATLTNGGASATGIALQGYIEQLTNGVVTATRPAGGVAPSCGAAAGVLPTTTTTPCSVPFTAGASNAGVGTGTFVPGPARFVLHLIQNGTDVETSAVDITLAVPGPQITVVNLPSTTLSIGLLTTGTASIDNPGAQKTGVIVQNYIRQGTTYRAAAGSVVNCGLGGGILPTGTCNHSLDVVPSNTNSGDGTLVAGAATLEVQLIIDNVVVQTKTVAITLVGSPTILSITPGSASIAIGQAMSYTAVIDNSTGSPFTGVSLLAFIDQDSQKISRSAGVDDVMCASQPAGTLPTGRCGTHGTATASNEGIGTGVLTPGPAMLRLKLYINGVTVDAMSVPINLTP